MTCDLMQSKQRAWACAGFGWLFDDTLDEPLLMLAEGERPILCIPAQYDARKVEVAFGWGMADLAEQSMGWLALMMRCCHYIERDTWAA